MEGEPTRGISENNSNVYSSRLVRQLKMLYFSLASVIPKLHACLARMGKSRGSCCLWEATSQNKLKIFPGTPSESTTTDGSPARTTTVETTTSREFKAVVLWRYPRLTILFVNILECFIYLVRQYNLAQARSHGEAFVGIVSDDDAYIVGEIYTL